MWGINPAFADDAEVQTKIPAFEDTFNGEFWFEAVDWIVAAQEARDRFVMVTLGAAFRYQAIASHGALRLLNPMPYKLVAVEPVPQKLEWTRRHMRDNGIDPEQQWLLVLLSQKVAGDCHWESVIEGDLHFSNGELRWVSDAAGAADLPSSGDCVFQLRFSYGPLPHVMRTCCRSLNSWYKNFMDFFDDIGPNAERALKPIEPV